MYNHSIGLPIISMLKKPLETTNNLLIYINVFIYLFFYHYLYIFFYKERQGRPILWSYSGSSFAGNVFRALNRRTPTTAQNIISILLEISFTHKPQTIKTPCKKPSLNMLHTNHRNEVPGKNSTRS